MKPTVLAAALILAADASAIIQSRRIVYTDGIVKMEGYMAWNDTIQGKRPGVLIVHDWTGRDGYEERRARMLAELGYVGFACDVYGADQHPTKPEEFGKLAGRLKGDLATFRARLVASLRAMSEQPEVDSKQMAAIGYCFGGTGVLELARTGAALRGIVSFHGGLGSTTKDADKIRCEVNIQHGEADPFVPKADIDQLKADLDAAHVKWSFTAYPGAVHAFTVPEAGNDPSKGAAYDKVADARSWDAMKAFFRRIFH